MRRAVQLSVVQSKCQEGSPVIAEITDRKDFSIPQDATRTEPCDGCKTRESLPRRDRWRSARKPLCRAGDCIETLARGSATLARRESEGEEADGDMWQLCVEQCERKLTVIALESTSLSRRLCLTRTPRLALDHLARGRRRQIHSSLINKLEVTNKRKKSTHTKIRRRKFLTGKLPTSRP